MARNNVSGNGSAPGAQQQSASGNALDLQHFVLALLERCGAVVEVPSFALAEALLPDELAAELALPCYLRLAFDYEVAGENPGAEFITYGSPVLDRLLRVGQRLGRLHRRYAGVQPLTVPSGLLERVEKSLEFVRCRRPGLRAASLVAVEYVRFDFRVQFLSDEKQEALYPVLVDCQAASPVNHQLSWLESAFFAPEPGAELARLPAAEHCGYQAAYALAKDGLPAVIHQDLAAFQRRIAGYLREEEERLRAYYQATLRELEQRARRLTDESRLERVRGKQAAAAADFTARLEDVRQKYQVSVEAELDSVTAYVLPKVRLTVEVRNSYDQYNNY